MFASLKRSPESFERADLFSSEPVKYSRGKCTFPALCSLVNIKIARGTRDQYLPSSRYIEHLASSKVMSLEMSE